MHCNQCEGEQLIDDGTIEKPVHENITYDEVYDTMDHLWNFMFLRDISRKRANGFRKMTFEEEL